MAALSRCPLHDLADELLVEIVAQVGSKKDLCSLAVTCSRLQAFAEPRIYEDYLVRHGSHVLRILDCVAQRPERALAIRALHIQYPSRDRAGITFLNPVMRQMLNLRELTIEAPCCNDPSNLMLSEYFHHEGKIQYADYFAWASEMVREMTPMGTQLRVRVPLQTFTLHSHMASLRDRRTGQIHGRDAFNMGKNAAIFLHPTLRNLTISCFDINEDIAPILSPKYGSTPLKSLTFDECNIKVEGLAAILSVPKALERLTLGERMHCLEGYLHSPLGTNPAPFLDALALQEHSLQYIKHIGGHTPSPAHPSRNLSMANFTQITEMELDMHSALANILSETAPPWSLTAPPTLHLRLIRCTSASTKGKTTPQRMLEWLRRVPELDYILDNDMIPRSHAVTELWYCEACTETWAEIAEFLAPQGEPQISTDQRRLRVFVLESTGFIPPYMLGEPRPVETLLYDSSLLYDLSLLYDSSVHGHDGVNGD
ncbi:hypothetical protein LZ554_001228 [Drepanopeziza brunnea f. sp. 'monogermtubi']|nr:hypothetical protein LZ554_001228 [Drepanopeziza brunnea f. sp. 'monogermtubi']